MKAGYFLRTDYNKAEEESAVVTPSSSSKREMPGCPLECPSPFVEACHAVLRQRGQKGGSLFILSLTGLTGFAIYKYSKRHNKFLLPVPAKAIYGSFCRTENEIFNVVNYNKVYIISVFSSISILSILKITGRVPSEQQAIIVFSSFIQPRIIEPPCNPA